jgi:hypothetical protein
MRKLLCAGSGITLVLLWAITACAQSTGSRGKSQGAIPRLPGAVSKALDWSLSDAPFDVARHFQGVPQEQNAAPLYLDALYEFGAELEVCFPEGAARSRRSEAARARSKRCKDLVDEASNNPGKELGAGAVDEVIKLYDVGYRKLAEAQRLPRCVFEAGVSAAALLPHAQVSR